MPTYVDNKKIKKVFLGKDTKIKKIFYGTDLVFTSGTAVSYYSGSKFLGTEDVDDGESILSPSSDIIDKVEKGLKPGYFLAGWSFSKDGDVIKSFDASEDLEQISLYAVILPDQVTLYTATWKTAGNGGFNLYDFGYDADSNLGRYLTWNKATSIMNNPTPSGAPLLPGMYENWVGIVAPFHWQQSPYYYEGAVCKQNSIIGREFNLNLNGYKKAVVTYGYFCYISKGHGCKHSVIDKTNDVEDVFYQQNNDTIYDRYQNFNIVRTYTNDFNGELRTFVKGDGYNDSQNQSGQDGWVTGYTFIKSIELYKE